MITDRPVRIYDQIRDVEETVRVEEAERLMGLEAGATKAPDTTEVTRLKALGNGLCIITMRMLFEAIIAREEEQQLSELLPQRLR